MAALIFLGRLLINFALTADMGGNVALLGRPGETISHRVARLRAYGGRLAPVGCVLCRALSALFWFMHRDHCDWAMDGQDGSGFELSRWSK